MLLFKLFDSTLKSIVLLHKLKSSLVDVGDDRKEEFLELIGAGLHIRCNSVCGS